MANFKIQYHQFDVLVVGGGGAGLRAALSAALLGRKVAVVSKVHPICSHTAAAKGGINAPLGNREKDDWRWMMYDTVKGSAFLADQDAVEFMCRSAADEIVALEKMGVPFSRDSSGKIYQRAYGGQSTDYGNGSLAFRACAVADRTGHALLYTLHQQCMKLGVTFFNEFFATDLIHQDGEFYGVTAIELETGDIHLVTAGATILATGGFGYAYALTTSSSICTGDGNAMALRAGIALKDMEFVQFHPTGVYGVGCLITEGSRGEGAYLVNRNGERFMEKYDPKFKDLAPRDFICRAIIKEIAEGRGLGEKMDHVALRVSHLGEKTIHEKLPTVLEVAKIFARVDALKEDIPVAPSVHYTMGGIPTNWNGKVKNNLFAVGETACNSVHGANRLGCNSLLDLMVFGNQAGRLASEFSIKVISESKAKELAEKSFTQVTALVSSSGTLSPLLLIQKLKNIASSYAGITRNENRLKQGIQEINSLENKFADIKISSKSLAWNADVIEALELINMTAQIKCVLSAALARTESRGAHFREDFPQVDNNNFMRHSIANGLETVEFYEVRTTPLSNDTKNFLPAA